MASKIENSRRRFMAHFASIGLGATLVPEILWSQVPNQAAPKITLEMAKGAADPNGSVIYRR